MNNARETYVRFHGLALDLKREGLIGFELAKLVAAAAMWEGQEWGGYCCPWRTRPRWSS